MGEPVEVVGSYRFDDPEGRVGLEAHLVTSGDNPWCLLRWTSDSTADR